MRWPGLQRAAARFWQFREIGRGNSPGAEMTSTEEVNVRAGIPTILVVVLLIVLLVWLL